MPEHSNFVSTPALLERFRPSPEVKELLLGFSAETVRMVLGYTVNHLYCFPVEKVVEAHLKKLYAQPEKKTLHIMETEHRNDPDGLEYAKRKITTCNTTPDVFRKKGIMDDDIMQTEEEVWMDHPGRRFWLRLRNISFADSITFQANSTFVPDTNNPDWTRFEEAGGADMSSSLGIIGVALEVFYKTVMESSVRQNISLMEKILQKSP